MTLADSSRRLRTLLALGRLVPSYLAIAVVKHVRPLPWLARWAWRAPARTRHPEGRVSSPAAQILIGRVLRAGQIVGVPDRDCLQRSLLLYRELSRVGADPTLVVGFRRSGGVLMGHTWVVADGEAVAESARDLEAFTPVCQFGRSGRPIPEVS